MLVDHFALWCHLAQLLKWLCHAMPFTCNAIGPRPAGDPPTEAQHSIQQSHLRLPEALEILQRGGSVQCRHAMRSLREKSSSTSVRNRFPLFDQVPTAPVMCFSSPVFCVCCLFTGVFEKSVCGHAPTAASARYNSCLFLKK